MVHPFVAFAAFEPQWDFDNFLLWHCHVTLYMAQHNWKLKDNNQVRAKNMYHVYYCDQLWLISNYQASESLDTSSNHSKVVLWKSLIETCKIFSFIFLWHMILMAAVSEFFRHAFATISFIAETFIFLYVGMDALDIDKWRDSSAR